MARRTDDRLVARNSLRFNCPSSGYNGGMQHPSDSIVDVSRGTQLKDGHGRYPSNGHYNIAAISSGFRWALKEEAAVDGLHHAPRLSCVPQLTCSIKFYNVPLLERSVSPSIAPHRAMGDGKIAGSIVKYLNSGCHRTASRSKCGVHGAPFINCVVLPRESDRCVSP